MKYFCFYSRDEERRNYALAATNKVDYICEAIAQTGRNVDIISACTESYSKKLPGKIISLSDKINLHYLPAQPYNNIISKVLSVLLGQIRIFLFLLTNVRKYEEILVYHSLRYLWVIALAKKIKKFRLILEVEEIYGDVLGKKNVVKREQHFFSLADKFLFATELLDEKINTSNKKSAVIYGTYKVSPILENRIDDGKIHCVYAGTFDPRKGGAFAAVNAAEFLNDEYHIHIIGFGSDKEKELLNKLIQDVSRKTKCVITFDGCFSGDEYLKFIQKCHIGLSTQNPEGAYNNTSFPSKILSYMANGLEVVSIRIPVIELSSICDNITYYNENSGQAIAKAISSVVISEANTNRCLIADLNVAFTENLKTLLG